MVQVQLTVAMLMAVALRQMLKIQKDHHFPMTFANDNKQSHIFVLRIDTVISHSSKFTSLCSQKSKSV